MSEPELSYQAFLKSKDSTEVTSLIAYWTHDRGRLRAVMWHASRKEWISAPSLAAGILFDDAYTDEARSVDRATAETMARVFLHSTLPTSEELQELAEEGERMGWEFGPPRT
ncbi:hypothetical protein ACIBSW_36350 [Actinoplanes sp. NPDC049668]|uniref:hypothetical protein n=1 Tax=unclassified Actinoplanes TaxID=2626549 RepID=UPI00339F0E50